MQNFNSCPIHPSILCCLKSSSQESDAEPHAQDIYSALGVQEFWDSWWNTKAVLPYSFLSLSSFLLPFLWGTYLLEGPIFAARDSKTNKKSPLPWIHSWSITEYWLTRKEIMAIKVCRSDIWTECFRSSRKRAIYLRKRLWDFVIFRERVLQSAWSIVQSLAKVMMSIMTKTVKAALILIKHKRENAM